MTQRKKILLVDDSSTVLMVEQMILKNSPFDIVIARDGEAGFETAVKERPDLILMDVMMPRMDGFDALREIRAHEEIKDIPVIMVTTRGEGVNIETGYTVGCNDYVTKPINGSELLSKINNLIGS